MPTPSSIAARPSILLAALGAFALVLAVVLFAYTVQAQGQDVTPTQAATGDNPPAQPTNLQVSAAHDSVSLTWTASTDETVTHYAILRRNRDTDPSQVFHVIDGNAGPGTSYTDRSVSAQGSYVYRVKAVSPTGVSQWSGYARADTPAAPEPTATPTPTPTPTPEPTATPTPEPDQQTDSEATPEDLAPTGLGVNLVENRVTLTWEAPANDADSVTGYEVLRRRPKEGEGALQTLVADTGSADTAYVDATANEPGVRYTYRVKALRGGDVSRESNFAFIDLPEDYTPPEPEPASEPDPAALAPSNLTAEIADDGVALSWDAPAQDAESVTGYEVLRSFEREPGITSVDLTPTGAVVTGWVDQDATEPGVRYTYRVLAVRGGEKSGWSNAAHVEKVGVALPQVGERQTVATVLRVLVKNTGKSVDDFSDLDSGFPKRAQAFTTGSNDLGYTLSSIGIEFALIDLIDNPVIENPFVRPTATLNEASGSNPGNALCTLTGPASFSQHALNTFGAPRMGAGACPMLMANTTYYFVLERTDTSGFLMRIDRTDSTSEDSGAAAGWSIGNRRHYLSEGSWDSTGGQAHMIEVRGAVGPIVNICDRTWWVRDRLLELTPSNDTCNAVSGAELAAIETLDFSGVSGGGIFLKAGAFDGLTGLTELDLSGVGIAVIDVGDGRSSGQLRSPIFAGLDNLETLRLGDNRLFPRISDDAFEGLDNLRELDLRGFSQNPAGRRGNPNDGRKDGLGACWTDEEKARIHPKFPWDPRGGSPTAFAPLTNLETYNVDADFDTSRIGGFDYIPAAPSQNNYVQPADAPQNLRLFRRGEDYVLTWDAPTGESAITGYRIERDLNDYGGRWRVKHPKAREGGANSPCQDSLGRTSLVGFTYYDRLGDRIATTGADQTGYTDALRLPYRGHQSAWSVRYHVYTLTEDGWSLPATVDQLTAPPTATAPPAAPTLRASTYLESRFRHSEGLGFLWLEHSLDEGDRTDTVEEQRERHAEEVEKHAEDYKFRADTEQRRIRLSWTPFDPSVASYEIQYRRSPSAGWQTIVADAGNVGGYAYEDQASDFFDWGKVEVTHLAFDNVPANADPTEAEAGQMTREYLTEPIVHPGRQYRVRAINSVGAGAWSEAVTPPQ